MRSYLHTITQHQAYIEKLSLSIKIKLKDFETRIEYTTACVRCIQKKGHGHERRDVVTAHFCQESQHPDWKR